MPSLVDVLILRATGLGSVVAGVGEKLSLSLDLAKRLVATGRAEYAHVKAELAEDIAHVKAEIIEDIAHIKAEVIEDLHPTQKNNRRPK